MLTPDQTDQYDQPDQTSLYKVISYSVTCQVRKFDQVDSIDRFGPTYYVSVIYSVQAYKVRIKSVRQISDLQLATPGSNNVR